MKDKKSFAEAYPELVKEWHPTKNGTLTPYDVSMHSGKKVWWQLVHTDEKSGNTFSFEWESAIINRARGAKCPYLVGKRVMAGFNDLATVNPLLCRQWDYDKNDGLKPDAVSPRSTKEVWWICEKQHSWKARVTDRSLDGTCPFCSKESATSFEEFAIFFYLRKADPSVIHGYNDLGFELDVFLPQKKVAIEYDGEYWHKDKINSDLAKNEKCEENKIILYRFRENELGPLDSSSHDICVTRKSFDCVLSELIVQLYNVRVDVNTRRDESEINKLRDFATKEESLLVVNPELAKQWHPIKNGKLLPSSVTANSAKSVWWYFPYDDETTGKHFDFEWEATIYTRNRDAGCPFLCGRAVWEGFNDLSTTNPELAEQWHPKKNGNLTPQMVSAGSRLKVWWQQTYYDSVLDKTFEFEWAAEIRNRKHGQDCPYLSGESVLIGFNDLETRFPELAKQWHPTKNEGLRPSDVTCKSSKSVWWYMPFDDVKTGKHFDFEWSATVFNRTKGTECPYLKNKAVWKGYNDLATTNPALAAEWHPTKNGNLKPIDVTEHCGKKVWWLLHYYDNDTHKYFDFEWEATVNNRANGVGCPYLSGREVYVGYNDLATTRPDIAAEWHPTKNGKLLPTDVTKNSNREVWWIKKTLNESDGTTDVKEWVAPIYQRCRGGKNG